jgi:hypothetical protein
LLALQIIFGVLTLLLIILILPVHMYASFDGDLRVRVGVMFFNFTLYPRPPQSEKKKRKKEIRRRRKAKDEQELSRTEELLRNEGVSAVISYYAEMAELIKSAVKRLLKTITVDKFNLTITVASEDACQTAVDYGRACAVVYPVQALLESLLRIRRRNITITPDFLGDKGKVEGEIRIHAIPLRVLWNLLLLFLGYIGNNISESKKVHKGSSAG